MKLLQVFAFLLGSLAIVNAVCASNEWNDGGVCKACHWACKTCSGGAQTECSSCATDFFVQPGDNSAPYTCLPTCPHHYFGNNTSGSCQICDATCGWCDYSATNCAEGSCAYNHFWTYAAPRVCQPCNSNCDGCWQSANNCVACQPGLTYNADHTCTGPAVTCHQTCAAGQCTGPADNQCTECNPGFFLNANNKCKPCNANCATCTGTALKCTACADGKWLNGNTCSACHLDCATCTGGAANNCLSCNGGKPVLVGSSCYPACVGIQKPAGFIKCDDCTVANHCRNNNCRDAQVNCVNCIVGWHKDPVTQLCVADRRNLRE